MYLLHAPVKLIQMIANQTWTVELIQIDTNDCKSKIILWGLFVLGFVIFISSVPIFPAALSLKPAECLLVFCVHRKMGTWDLIYLEFQGQDGMGHIDDSLLRQH